MERNERKDGRSRFARLLDGGDQLVGELVALDVDDLGVGVLAADAVGDGVEQMGLAHTGGAVDEEGIVDVAGGICNGDGGAVGEAVAGTHDEILKGELGGKLQGAVFLAAGAVLGKLLVVEDDDLGVGIEDLLEGVLDIFGAAAGDDLPAEIRGGIEDQMLVVELHHLGVVEPARHGDGAQPLLHMDQNLRPDIGG